MGESPRRFAQLLTEALYRVKTLENKSIAAIQDELGFLVGREGGSVIEYWRKEHLPPHLGDVEKTARALVTRGQLDRAWLYDFLTSAGHPAPGHLCDELCAPGQSDATAPVTTLPTPLIAYSTPAGMALDWPRGRLPEPGPLPHGSVMPFGRNPFFVGRDQDLMALAAALRHQQTAAIGQVETAAATGLGGIGKTQLACEFVHRYGQYFPGGVFWLNFDNGKAIPAAIAACGDAARLDLHPDFHLRPLEEQVRLVQTAWQEPIARLLVFDNCEDPALLARWRPTTGGCRVLVTSRRGEWDQALDVQMIALGVLRRDASLDLLRHHCPDADRLTLDAIAEELGDLPLALHLAGSYLYRYRRAISPADYLEQLRQPDLLAHPSLQGHTFSPTGHIQHVGRTFSLGYDRLDPDDARDILARGLLVRMAHFAPGEPVWYDLLVRTVGINQNDRAASLRVADAFTRLIELGLVETESDNVLRMHRLIAVFVQQVAEGELEETRQAVEQVVFDEIAYVNRRGYPVPLLARQAHLRSVVDVARARDDSRSAALCSELGTYLWQVGDFDGAKPYYEKALSIRQKLFGEQHLATAESLHLLGNLLRDTDQFAAARAAYAKALAVRQRLLGEEHLDVAETLNSLGWLLWQERQVEPTRQYLERALAIGEKLLGEEHRLIADYANNLGLCLQDCVGDLPGAQRCFEKSLRIRQRVLSDNHPLVAISLNNMGYVLHTQGLLDEARRYYERTLALRLKLWGSDHADVAVTLKNLGTVVQDLGDLEEARTLLERALATYIRALGDEHSRTSFCLDSLGRLHQQLGDLDGAQVYLDWALNVRRKTFRPDHPHLATSLEHLADVMLAKGERATAKLYLTEALVIRQNAQGADHALTVTTARRLDSLQTRSTQP